MDTHKREDERGRGRNALAPTQMPGKAWKDILWRTWGEISNDRITLIAAGSTYYLLLALFPTLVAFISLYGLFTDPSTVNQHLALLSGIVPPGGIEILHEQLTRLTQQGPVTLGWGLALSLGLALWLQQAPGNMPVLSHGLDRQTSPTEYLASPKCCSGGRDPRHGIVGPLETLSASDRRPSVGAAPSHARRSPARAAFR